jgi:hypothetical protein
MNMPIIVRLATKADLSNRSAAVALRDFEPLMTAVGQTRSFGDVGSMSGLPPEAAVERTSMDGSNVPTAEMHDRDQDAETVLAALRMTSRTTPGFDSMGT